MQLFKRILERIPNHTEARRNLAMAYLESGDKEQAKNHLIEVLRLDPKDAWSYVILGNIAKSEKRIDQADRFYRRAYELKPNDALLLANYGVLMVDRGNQEQAEEFFERAIEANPSYPNSYYGLALLRFQAGKASEALGVLDRLFSGAKPVDARGFLLMREAQKLYLEVNREIANSSFDEFMTFVEEKKTEAEKETGYPIMIAEDNSLGVLAISQMAWKHGGKELFWLKPSSASIQTSLIHSRRELVIMVQAIQHWERDDLGFSLRLWS